MLTTDRQIGIVVPTLGTRPEYLVQCLESIKVAGSAFVAVVAPRAVNLDQVAGLFDLRVDDPGTGLAQAIDTGIRALPPSIKYVNWLGDDDLLLQDSLRLTFATLESDRNLAFVYGGCDYVDAQGRILWTNRSGRWARWLLRFGPDLIPQPGALMTRDAYNAIGGLSFAFGWAFDLDLFIRLQEAGRAKYIPRILSQFRWHSGSLSVGGRTGSSAEAKRIRLEHLPRPLRAVAWLWEIPFALVGGAFARRLSKKSNEQR